MMYTTTSVFPVNVDNLEFIHDISLDDIAFQSEYDAYIANGEYNKAGSLLEQYNGKVGLSADLFNAYEIRISTLQNYLILKAQNVPEKERVVFSDSEPAELVDNMTWI